MKWNKKNAMDSVMFLFFMLEAKQKWWAAWNRKISKKKHTEYSITTLFLSPFFCCFIHHIFEMWVCQSRTHNYVPTVVYNVQHAFVCRISLLNENRMVKIERKKASKLTSFRMCDKNEKKRSKWLEQKKRENTHTHKSI